MEQRVLDKIRTGIASKLYIDAGLAGEPTSRMFFWQPSYPLENCVCADRSTSLLSCQNCFFIWHSMQSWSRKKKKREKQKRKKGKDPIHSHWSSILLLHCESTSWNLWVVFSFSTRVLWKMGVSLHWLQVHFSHFCSTLPGEAWLEAELRLQEFLSSVNDGSCIKLATCTTRNMLAVAPN